jgi:hypothetical protein
VQRRGEAHAVQSGVSPHCEVPDADAAG